MSEDVKDRIRNELVEDKAVITKFLSEVKKHLTLTEDGEVIIEKNVENASPETKIIVYALGHRFAFEADLRESPIVTNQDMYSCLALANSTVRKKLASLKDKGLLTQEDSGEYKIDVPTIPRAAQYIKKGIEEGSDS